MAAEQTPVPAKSKLRWLQGRLPQVVIGSAVVALLGYFFCTTVIGYAATRIAIELDAKWDSPWVHFARMSMGGFFCCVALALLVEDVKASSWTRMPLLLAMVAVMMVIVPTLALAFGFHGLVPAADAAVLFLLTAFVWWRKTGKARA